MPAGLEATCPVPPPLVATPSANVGTTGLKRAVTFLATLIVTVHVGAVPLHAPLHPPNALPALGVAVSVTLVPTTTFAVQVPGQLMPAGLVTVPLPEPLVLTASTFVATSKRAVTVTALVIDTVQLVPVVPAHAPPQPPNVSVPVGVAVSVTGVPYANAAAHAPLVGALPTVQATPTGLVDTEPLPVEPDAPSTVSVDGAGLKEALTAASASGDSVHVEPVAFGQPLQPAKLEPPTGAAVSVTGSPAGSVSVQVLAAALVVVTEPPSVQPGAPFTFTLPAPPFDAPSSVSVNVIMRCVNTAPTVLI